MMMRSAVYSIFLAVMAFVASGCVCTDHCGGPAGGSCDGACGGCCDGGCGGDVDFCSHCDGIGCPACYGKSPGHLFKRLVNGAGCGQVYWDEWINDPPYCCDPCDDHPQWVGPRCCPPSITDAWKRLWGHRYHDGRQGCNACIMPHSPNFDGELIDGEIIDGEFIDGEFIEGEIIEQGPASEPANVGRARVTNSRRADVSVLNRSVPSRRPYYQRGS